MKNIGSILCLVLTIIAVGGCGGGAVDSGSSLTSNKLLATTTTVGANYETVVQQLYISYFGRPADTGGLSNFQSQLVALNAPTDIQNLVQAYGSNVSIRSLINSFGLRYCNLQ
jgi:hypothetical protein